MVHRLNVKLRSECSWVVSKFNLQEPLAAPIIQGGDGSVNFLCCFFPHTNTIKSSRSEKKKSFIHLCFERYSDCLLPSFGCLLHTLTLAASSSSSVAHLASNATHCCLLVGWWWFSLVLDRGWIYLTRERESKTNESRPAQEEKSWKIETYIAVAIAVIEIITSTQNVGKIKEFHCDWLRLLKWVNASKD